MAKQLKLDYRVTDPEMFEVSKTKHEFFEEDKADFIAFDADFADPFADEWTVLTETTEAIPTEETLNDQLTQLTTEVEAQMKTCREKFQDTKYFIEKAFPDNIPVWNEFGYNTYESARKSQLKMIQFMKGFHVTATKYSAQLIANGYSLLKINEIETFRAALNEANVIQETFIGNKPVLTQTRYTENNKVWALMVQVCTAGKRIFKDDFAKYQRYLLPPDDEDAELLLISGKVIDGTTLLPLENVAVTIDDLGIGDDTTVSGKYGFGAVPDGTYILKFDLATYEVKEETVTITGGIAVVKNVTLVKV